MGLGGISIWQLLIVLAIVVLLFGTKKLSSLGSDVGGAVKGFRKAMNDDDGKGDEDHAESAALPDKEADGATASTHARKTDKTS